MATVRLAHAIDAPRRGGRRGHSGGRGLALGGLALLGALGAAAVPPASAEANVTVRLAPETMVRGDEISLGDLATIEGEPELASRLRQVKLGPAPAPGLTQRIDLEYLRMRLGDGRLVPERVELIAPEQVVVSREFQVVTGTAIAEAASRQIQERLAALAPSDEPYAVAALSRPQDARVPAGALEITATLPGAVPGHGVIGATVVVKVDGKTVQTLPQSFRIGRYRSVIVAARALEARTTLGPNDWRVERRATTEVPAGALAAMPDAADLETAQPIKAGDVLTPAVVRPRLLVRRGDLVTLVVEGPGFRITSQGLAVTDGRRGDALRVVNPTSKRETLGKVEAAGLVRVPFQGQGSDQ